MSLHICWHSTDGRGILSPQPPWHPSLSPRFPVTSPSLIPRFPATSPVLLASNFHLCHQWPGQHLFLIPSRWPGRHLFLVSPCQNFPVPSRPSLPMPCLVPRRLPLPTVSSDTQPDLQSVAPAFKMVRGHMVLCSDNKRSHFVSVSQNAPGFHTWT